MSSAKITHAIILEEFRKSLTWSSWWFEGRGRKEGRKGGREGRRNIFCRPHSPKVLGTPWFFAILCETELSLESRAPFARLHLCENTRAAWQLFFTARTWAKPHRFKSSVALLLLRRVVQSKTQWHSNVFKLLKLLQKSSQASKTFFQLLQIKRLQLKLTNNLQNSYQISSQRQVPKTWDIQKHQKPQKQTKIHLQALPCTSWFHLVPNWFLPGSYRFLWVL